MSDNKPLPSFIGEKEIKELERTGVDLVKIKFTDGSETEIHNELLEMIVRPVKNDGSITDTVVHILATKFVSELSTYGLELYMVDSIAQGMRTLTHNLREEAIGKAFDCTGALDIKLSKLV